MTLIEGVGDEVIQFFVALFFILIVTLAWFTTNISSEGTLRTVFLLERRRLRSSRRLTNHTESATIAESTLINSAEEELNNTRETIVQTTEEDKPPESRNSEETEIVETMDAQIVESEDSNENEIRRRRLAFYESSENNVNIEENNDRICVKLMYLNDELRHVEGRLDEKLGDFKRRHFEMELSRNKVIKLIFNGHILQPDTETLQSCGLFNNCVVHCLIHQKPNNGSGNVQGTSTTHREFNTDSVINPQNSNNNNNNNQQHEWHLENYLFGISCCFLGAAWYLRYVYAHLYTVTATIGLILMTGIFTIIMYGIHFPDNVEMNSTRQNSNNNARAL